MTASSSIRERRAVTAAVGSATACRAVLRAVTVVASVMAFSSVLGTSRPAVRCLSAAVMSTSAANVLLP